MVTRKKKSSVETVVAYAMTHSMGGKEPFFQLQDSNDCFTIFPTEAQAKTFMKKHAGKCLTAPHIEKIVIAFPI